MSGVLWFLTAVSAVLVPKESVGLTCLTGTDIAIPRDNLYVQNCGPHEVCFLDAFATPNGFIKYNIGCRDRQFCTGGISHGRRSTDNTTITGEDKRSSGNTKFCDICCDTDLCNSAGCGATGYPSRSHRGPVCYACAQQRGPGLCDKITLCGMDSVCKIKLHPPPATGDVYYVSQCENKQRCENDATYSAALVGRKRYSHEILTATKTCLVKCCDTDLCTGYCGTSPLPTLAPNSVTNPCLSNPCAYGTCLSQGTSYICQCQHGYSGPNCRQHVVSGGCPVGWRKYGHSCYLIDKYKTGTWDQANAICKSYGAYLAEANTDNENAFLLQASTGSLRGDWWIGGDDKSAEGHWIWSHSKQTIPYGSPHWGHHRPNNIVSSHGEDEDCLEFQENIQAWNDEHCSDGYDNFICEKSVW